MALSPANTAQPLRILMAACVPSRRGGGFAATIHNLGHALEARGHSVSCMFLPDLVDPESVGPRFRDALFAFRLAKYIAENQGKFSVVNLHAPAGFAYGLRRKWSISAHLPPYVMTLHGLEERRKRVMRSEAAKGNAWNFSLMNRLWHRLYHQPRFNWSIRTADASYVFCRDAWTILQLKYDLDPQTVAFIPPGVESRFFVPREYHNGPGLRLLFPGTWLDQRGIFYIREALTRLAPRLPGLRITFAGCGAPESLLTDFFGPQLSRIVEIRTTIPAEYMPALYAEHDVLLFPSLMEGYSRVLREAMASGMPVVTTETCGMVDIVEDGYNGLLIPPADAAAIEQAILRLSGSPELRAQLGRAARETMKRYTWERSATLLEEMFRRVIASNGGAR